MVQCCGEQAGCRNPELRSQRASPHHNGMWSSAARAQSASGQQLLCSWGRAGAQPPAFPSTQLLSVFWQCAWLHRHTKFGHSAGAKEIGGGCKKQPFLFPPPTSVYRREEQKHHLNTRLFFRQRNLTCP